MESPGHGVLEWLGSSKEEIHKRLLEEVSFVSTERSHKDYIPPFLLERWKREGRAFFVMTEDGKELFPTFQFHYNFPALDIKKILDFVPEDSRGWSLLCWFATRNTLLSLKRPMDIPKKEFRKKKVVGAAKHFFVRESPPEGAL